MSDYKASKQDILALRELVPVGVMSAKRYLETTSGDLEKSRKLFLENEISRLADLTEYDEESTGEIFFECDFNTQQTIDKIRDVQFFASFNPANSKSQPRDIIVFEQWLEIVKEQGLMKSLQMKEFDSVFSVVYDTGYLDFSDALIEAHILLNNKEIFFRQLDDEELIKAVQDLRKHEVYTKAMEQYKLNVLLEPEFLKVFSRLKRVILKTY